MKHFLNALKKYAVFSGRASRAEFWYFVLFSQLLSVPFQIIDSLLRASDITPFFTLVYSLVIFIPSIAVSIRRLHDVNKSGWNFLLPLIPIVGAIMYFILLIKKGDEIENQYGLVPNEDLRETINETPTQQQIPTTQVQQKPIPEQTQTNSFLQNQQATSLTNTQMPQH